jgi:transposase
MEGEERPRGEHRSDVEWDAGDRMDTQKKTQFARERDREDVKAKRETFLENQAALDPARLIFLDESGFRLGAPPHYGWAVRGEKSPGKSVQGSWETITMIGALALDGFRGFMTIDSGTSADVFRAFVSHQLVPNLHDGDVVVMDNLSAHKNAAAIEMIRTAGADVLFLPPYSPEYNPIERAWSKMKEMMRRTDTLTRAAFDASVAKAMAAISLDNIRAWTKFAGYELRSN